MGNGGFEALRGWTARTLGSGCAVAFRKYADRYPTEVGYRFNRRFDLPAMVPRLAVALVRATPCPEGASQMTAGLNT